MQEKEQGRPGTFYHINDINPNQGRPEGWVGGRISNQKNMLCSLLKKQVVHFHYATC